MPSPKSALSVAEKILERINTAEKAVALKGVEREAYLKALETVHGPAEKRAADMGFAKRDYFHGTEADVSQFDDKKLGSKMMHPSNKLGHFVTPDAPTANTYASMRGGNVMPVKIKKGGRAEFADGSNISDELYENILAHQKQSDAPFHVKDLNDHNTSAYQLDENGKLAPYAQANPEPGAADIAIVKDPKNIRSKYAAFDPRFKDSALLLAGAAGATAPAIKNPVDAVKDAYGVYDEYVQQPVARAADFISDKLIQASVPQEVPREERDNMKALGSQGLQFIGDPLNYVGAPIAAAGAFMKAKKGLKAAELISDALKIEKAAAALKAGAAPAVERISAEQLGKLSAAKEAGQVADDAVKVAGNPALESAKKKLSSGESIDVPNTANGRLLQQWVGRAKGQK